MGLRAPFDPQRAPVPLTIYLAFDGPTIGYAEVDDSRLNLSYIDRAAVDYAPYGDDAAQAAVVQSVRADWAPYAASITETRPAGGDYVLTVVSPTNPYAGEAAGIAPLDCEDQWTPNNVVFAFHGPNDGYSVGEQARTIGQEVAHSIGLEHTTFDEDILSYAYGPVDFWFVDACSSILTTPSSPEIFCADQHAVHCAAGSQNSHAELLAQVGEGVPDTEAPSLTITSPTDGAVLDAGSALEISVDAIDAFGVVEVELFANGEAMASDAGAPWGWPVSGIEPGHYTLWVEGRDGAGNVATSAQIAIEVRASVDDDDGEGGDDSDGDAGDDGAPGTSESGDDPHDDEAHAEPGEDDGRDDRPALPRGFGEQHGASDGTCAIDPRSTTSWASLLLLVCLVRGRR